MMSKNTGNLMIALILGLTALLLTGCPQGSGTGGDSTKTRTAVQQQPPPIKVVCTTGMLADIAARIGGEKAEVTGMMGPGVDPHLYKARESDVTALHEADVVIYNGLHLEARLGDLLEGLAHGKTVVAAAGGLPEEYLLFLEGAEGHPDPHVWFDVELFKLTTMVVAQGIAAEDQNNTQYYFERAKELQAEMDELDAYIRRGVELIPPEQRVLITAHDAFNYFGDAYGFEVVGLQGISTAAEAGTADVQTLANLIVERRLPAIFIESSVPERNIKAVQEAVAARGHDVEIGGELFSDALGDAGTPEGTYLGMVRHNVDTIVAALGPEGALEELHAGVAEEPAGDDTPAEDTPDSMAPETAENPAADEGENTDG